MDFRRGARLAVGMTRSARSVLILSLLEEIKRREVTRSDGERKSDADEVLDEEPSIETPPQIEEPGTFGMPLAT